MPWEREEEAPWQKGPDPLHGACSHSESGRLQLCSQQPLTTHPCPLSCERLQPEGQSRKGCWVIYESSSKTSVYKIAAQALAMLEAGSNTSAKTSKHVKSGKDERNYVTLV